MKRFEKLFIILFLLTLWVCFTRAQSTSGWWNSVAEYISGMNIWWHVLEEQKKLPQNWTLILQEETPQEIKFLGYSAIFISVFLWLITIFIIVCMWKIFKKAGIKWWKSLIPIQNIFILFKISWRKKLFRISFFPYLLLIYSTILRISYAIEECNMYWALCIPRLPTNFQQFIMTLFPIALIISFIFKWIMSFPLAKRFWKSKKFGLWLLFLSPIYYWILAFDRNSKYEY